MPEIDWSIEWIMTLLIFALHASIGKAIIERKDKIIGII